MITRIADTLKRDLAEVAREASRVLASGGIVAMPTDTVYGLAARADSDAAVRKLFGVKGRREDNPLPILLPDAESLERAAAQVPAAAQALADKYWPGPLTIVLPKVPEISDLVTAGRQTVGLRVPDHPIARAVLAACDFLVVVTSANPSAGRPAREHEEVRRDFSGKIELILAADRCPGGVPSTVVDMSGDEPRMVRGGAVPWSHLQTVLKQAEKG